MTSTATRQTGELPDVYDCASTHILTGCRGKVVIYDLKKDVRYTLTQKWDRSAGELAVSCL